MTRILAALALCIITSGCAENAAGLRGIDPRLAAAGKGGCELSKALCAAGVAPACIASPIVCAGSGLLSKFAVEPDPPKAFPLDADLAVEEAEPGYLITYCYRATQQEMTDYQMTAPPDARRYPNGDVDLCFDEHVDRSAGVAGGPGGER